ncbi:hypothetical protein QTH91_14470 [Variovorax dokdonensis]|uniref:DUF6798 domain-containing protein n=1 Tax=Variovorax dokdonensis TaxID=344883 RepID=A0ABT7NCL0_9BURK|nr:DUF6798 domain-containing protein [Variovorax dokdonensis]MDM0045692.1 hypothetical protein [Variovorax dokdonensis]
MFSSVVNENDRSLDRADLRPPLGMGIAAPGRPLAHQLLLTCLFVAASFAVNGYYFGGADHAIHFAFIERALHPEFLAGDPLVDRAQFHPTFLWPAIAALMHLAPLEWIYLALQAASAALMFSGVAALARALSPRQVASLAGVLAACMVLFARFSSAGLASFDVMLLNRSLSLGPLLFALALAAQGRFRAAFLLTGLTFNIHPTTAAHGAILVWFAAAFGPRRLVDALREPLWFLLGAAPLLVLMATTGGAAGVPAHPPKDWQDAQRLLLWFHHFPSLWPRSYWIALLPPLVAIAVSQWTKRDRVVLACLCGIVAACAAGYVGVELLGFPAALQLHLQETLRFLPYVAAAALAPWAAAAWNQGSAGKVRAIVAVTALSLDQVLTYPGGYSMASTVSFWVLALVLVLEIFRPRAQRATRQEAEPSLRWVVGVVLVAAIGGHLYRHVPIASTYESYYESRITQWARANLPADAVVAIPPYYYIGHAPLLNFRWAAGRRILGTLKDGGETTFSLSYFEEWRQRIEDAIGHPLDFSIPEDFRNHRNDWIEQAVADYGKADAARFALLAAKYGVTHAITEIGAAVQPELPVVYQDDRYRMYRVSAP